jgi:(R,R)-butanediol dehydrogenase/meso-butanediol dehydrogenase/diacetyl reductase
MRAIQWHGPGDLRYAEVLEPMGDAPGEAVVEVDYCGVCGTDFAEVRSGPNMIRTTPHPLTGECAPLALGHEFAGTVVATGPDAVVPVGTRVAVDPCWRCGTCFWCLRGDYHLCRLGVAVGLASNGALAPLVRVPAAGLVPLPDGVDTRTGALVEPLSVALHALDRSAYEPGDSLGIIGFGPIGAAVLLTARALGFGRIWVVEPSEERRRLAETFEADVVVEPDVDLYRQVMAQTSVGLDRVIECSGHPDALPASLNMVRRGGRLVVAGICNQPVAVDLRRVVLFEREVVGSLGYRHDFPRVLALIGAGRLDPTPLITRVVPFESAAAEIVRQAEQPAGTDLKTLVEVRRA